MLSPGLRSIIKQLVHVQTETGASAAPAPEHRWSTVEKLCVQCSWGLEALVAEAVVNVQR